MQLEQIDMNFICFYCGVIFHMYIYREIHLDIITTTIVFKNIVLIIKKCLPVEEEKYFCNLFNVNSGTTRNIVTKEHGKNYIALLKYRTYIFIAHAYNKSSQTYNLVVIAKSPAVLK